MKNKELNILLGGPAGSGIEKSGQVLCKSFVKGGYEVFANIEHSSQIRGGSNFLRIRISENPVQCHKEEIDIMIALDEKTINDHMGEMNDGGAVVFDGERVKMADEFKKKKLCFVDAPFRKMAEDTFQNSIYENVISIGIVFGLIEFDLNILKNILKKIFGNKAAEVVTANEKAAELGYEFAKKMKCDTERLKLSAGKDDSKMFLAGNDALCIGAIKAGVKFVGEYPMTPSSSVLHFMAAWAEKYGVIVKHTEDEIAAVNSIIGAGFAGARAIAATAGGGFALMSEGIGLASMNEVPIVVVNVMRPGPATGLPTRTAQGDLRQVIHAGQDDPVKIVLLPSDPQECFDYGFLAFNLAEKYQLPVIICYDKYLGESYYTLPEFKTDDLKIERGKILSEKDLKNIADFKRYEITKDGVSARSLPGSAGGIHRATSDEHNEYGEICEEKENRKMMVEKRMRKLETAKKDLPKSEIIGDKKADITFVTWCSNKPACVEACEKLKERNVRANVLVVKTAWPFLDDDFKKLFSQVKRAILVEQNFGGQMGGLIHEQTGINIEEKILKYDGRPLTVKDVIDNMKA